MMLNIVDDNLFNNAFHDHSLPSSSLCDVNYSCGSCGYELNLNSCNRNGSVIGSKGYGKSIKRGIISFNRIDETRFTRKEQLRCKPYFSSTRSWGLFQTRTKLLCRKCGNYVGNAYQPGFNRDSSSLNSLKRKESSESASSSSSSFGCQGISGAAIYDIRIRALQPTSCNGLNTIDMTQKPISGM